MFQTISMRQLEELLDGTRTFTLLDVRQEAEYERSHLEGAVNLPLAKIETASLVIPKERPVIVYCAYGGQSLMAARALANLGYEVINTSGGLNYYRGTHLTAGTA